MNKATKEAHHFTKMECKELKIELEEMDQEGNLVYTEEAQEIFNQYYDVASGNKAEDDYDNEAYQSKFKTN